MVIRGEKVNLRAVDRADAPLLHRWLNDPEVMRNWGAPDHTVSLSEVQRRVEVWLHDEGVLGQPVCLIVETLEGEAIGQVVLSERRPEARSVELSLMIGEAAWWGQGYGTDTLATVLGACFDSWNLHRVGVRSEASNERAHRLYARCGFRHEATLRDAAFLDGHFEDVLVFGLLESDQPSAVSRQLSAISRGPSATGRRQPEAGPSTTTEPPDASGEPLGVADLERLKPDG